MTEREYYLHTIDGRPGFFYSGEQICFANRGGYHRLNQRLVESLRQIRREQKASIKWRESQGFDNRATYGYVRVCLPEEPKL